MATGSAESINEKTGKPETKVIINLREIGEMCCFSSSWLNIALTATAADRANCCGGGD